MPARDKQVGGDHYKKLEIQPWDAMKCWMSPMEYIGYLRGCVIKYSARCWQKGGVQDLEKARHYLDELIDFVKDNPIDKPVQCCTFLGWLRAFLGFKA